MKTTTVPAQVTTVEDRIVGNLNFAQLFIVSLPVFIAGGLYIVLPPFVRMTLYKVVLSAIVLLICLSLAIRIRGKIVLQWLVVIFRYNARPRYFVFNKNDMFLRPKNSNEETKEETATTEVKQTKPVYKRLNIAQKVRLEGLVNDPRAKTHFEVNKQGGLRVRITEVK